MTSQADYHDRPEISRSMLSDFIESRRLYQMRYVTRDTPTWSRPSEQVFVDGTNIHTAILQPWLFDRIVRVVPANVLTANGQARGNRYDDWLDDEQAAARSAGIRDIVPVTQRKRDQLQRIADAVHTATHGLLDCWQAIVEQPIFWSEAGHTWRAMPDWLRQRHDQTFQMIDLKSCRDASPQGFRRACLKHRYWLQDAHYSIGVETALQRHVSEFLFVAVEKEPPYVCRVYRIDALDRLAARARRAEHIEQLTACYASGDWSDDGEGAVHCLKLEL